MKSVSGRNFARTPPGELTTIPQTSGQLGKIPPHSHPHVCMCACMYVQASVCLSTCTAVYLSV